MSKLCDLLVSQGKIRATPAFIRTDREAKLVKVCVCVGGGVWDEGLVLARSLAEAEVAVAVASAPRRVTSRHPSFQASSTPSPSFLFPDPHRSSKRPSSMARR